MDIQELGQYIFDLNRATQKSRGENQQPSKEAIKLATKFGKPELIACSLAALGTSYAEAGDVDLALNALDEANELFTSLPDRAKDDVGMCLMHCGYGIAYDDLGELAKALWHHEQSLLIANRTDIGYDQQRALLNIGHIYFRMGAGDQAIDFMSQAVHHPEQAPVLTPNAHSIIGEAYLLRQQYEKAKESYFEALKFKLPNPLLKKHSSNAALSLIMMGDLGEGKKLLDIANKIESDSHVATVECLLANCRYFLVTGDLDAALRSTEHIQSLGKSAGNLTSQWEATLLQAEILLLQKRYELCDTIIEKLFEPPLPFPLKYRLQELKIELTIQTESWKEAVFLQKELDEIEFVNQSKLLTLSKMHEEIHRAHTAQETNKILKMKNYELEVLHKEKDEILQIVSHDLKNPIATARLTVDMLIKHEEEMSAEKKAKNLVRLGESIGRMDDIVSQLTISESIDNQIEETQLCEIRLDHAVQKIVEQNLEQAHSKEQKLIVAPLLPTTIQGHPVWVDQIISNLISNAIKFTQQGGEIRVELIKNIEKGVARLEIIDNGQGLSQADMENIFRKYKKLSSLPTGGESSTGLGLYIIQQLVEKMGGSVSAHSKGKNQGSTFSVELRLEMSA